MHWVLGIHALGIHALVKALECASSCMLDECNRSQSCTKVFEILTALGYAKHGLPTTCSLPSSGQEQLKSFAGNNDPFCEQLYM
jgi:hypothetical protein